MGQEIILCANVIIKNENNQILLVKRINSDTQGGLWSIPGGTVEQGESIELALIREISEEISFSLIDFNFFNFLEFLSDKLRIIAFYYSCEVSSNIEIVIDNTELSDFKWFDFDEIQNLNLAFNQDIILESYISNIK